MNNNQIENEEIFDETYFVNDIYAEVYGEEYIEKIEEIKRCILDIETGKDKFKILNTEASLGKSLNSNKIIKMYLEANGIFKKRKFLIVKRFIKDILETEIILSENSKDYFNIKEVVGITMDNWNEWRENLKELSKAQVIIISHQRYIKLCEEKDTRKYFEQDRHTLIIDEKVDFPIFTFSKKNYDEIHSILPFGLENELSEACKPLKDMVSFLFNDAKTKHECLFCNPRIDKKILSKFFKLVKDNRDNIKFDDWDKVETFLHSLELLYSTRCIYNGGRISTFSRKHILWGLKNNLILDASGGIDHIYKSSVNNSLNRQMRVVDDTMMNIYPVKFNTSKTKIRNNRDIFLTEVTEMLKQKLRRDDQVLVVCHKENSEIIKDYLVKIGITDICVGDDYISEQIAINWFGNLIGKNTYSDFNVCWIIGKPNLPLESYPIHFMQYAQLDHVGRKPMTITQGKFKNEVFRNIQDGEVASELYQSAKRIQRNSYPTGDIYIVLDDDIVLSKVIADMKNPTVHMPIEMKFNERQQTKDKEAKVDEIIEYLKELKQGEYTKGEMCEKLEIEKSHLTRYLNNVKVKNLVDSLMVKFEKTKVIKF